MNRSTTLLALGMVLTAVGCNHKPDPRSRPGFVDTSDPSKVMQTMTAPPTGKATGPAATGPVKRP